MSSDKETLSIRVSKTMKLKLQAAAKKKGVSPSELLRRALMMIIEDKEQLGSPSCYDLAKDVVGSCKGPGPRDLSSDPKHMKGFGL